MGAAFRKIMRTPVAVDNWASLKEEAIRIHESLTEFVTYANSCSYRNKVFSPGQSGENLEQRFNLLKGQWWNIHTLLHSLINNIQTKDGEYTRLTSENRHDWLAKMKRKMELLISEFKNPLLITIPENNETL